MNTKFTALYERLSRDDEQQGESNSILNQKKYLEDYARSNGFKNVRHFSDDGFTGINFNRPGFQEMLDEVKAGNIETVIVKDMSRFGRNYLQVGFYTEMVFPDKGVRFIAVNNGIDSNNPTDNEFTPFLNIMNEWYAKDTSKKIRAVFRNRMENGLRCSGAIPYGFYRKADDKQTLYIDEEAAAVVRRIFQMAASGISVARIAEILREEKILIPAAYQDQKDNQVSRMHDYYDPYFWNKSTVVYILERQEYLGHTVLGKTITENFKTKKRRKAKPEELLFFPNTHEAIIDQETWDLANKLRKRSPKKTAPGTYSHRLSGFGYCADCGARMGYSAPSSKKIKAGTATDSDSTYNCGNFRNIRHNCTNHYVKATDLEAAILEATKLVASHILEDEDAFARELMEQWEAKQQMISSDDKKELSKAKNRLTELDSLIQGLYENQIKGIMPERQIQRLMSQYDNEQVSLEKRVSELEDTINNSTPEKPNPNRFITLIKKYKTFDEISDAMLYELIDRIEVHAPVGGRGKYRYQQIDVCFNFIGSYLPPLPVITEEERRAKIDEYYAEKAKAKSQRERARKKAWLANLKERAKHDPEAAAELEAHYEKEREKGRNARAKIKAKREADPEYQAMKEARRIEQERIHLHSNYITIAELKEKAKTDPEAAAALVERRRRQAAKNALNKQKLQERMANDPEYAAQVKAERSEKARKNYAKVKARLDKLKEQAETDPDAAAELQKFYDAHKGYAAKCQKKKLERMENDPEYAAEQKAKIHEKAKRQYAKQKAKLEDLKERAKTDPEAAKELERMKRKSSRATIKSRHKLREQAESDPEAAKKVRDRLDHRNEWAKNHKAELVELAKTDPEAAAKLADIRSRQVKATMKCRDKKKELAKTDPEIAAKLEARRQYMKEYNKRYREEHKAS
ncbi:MAG: recombinase family protein [Clostridiales bacterium]|nr:recombinase family protein [Clostridiales bacterium]